MDAVDVLVVVFREEIELLKLQARSFALYAPPCVLHAIHILYNDTDFAEFEPMFYAEIAPLYGPLLEKRVFTRSAESVLRRGGVCVQKLHTSDIVLDADTDADSGAEAQSESKTIAEAGIDTGAKAKPHRVFLLQHELRSRGWQTQQVLKLLAYTVCAQRLVLSLDAKYFLVRPLGFQSLLDADGRALSLRHDDPWTRPHAENAAAYFGLVPSSTFFACSPPCLMSTVDLSALSAYIQVREGMTLAAWFLFGSHKDPATVTTANLIANDTDSSAIFTETSITSAPASASATAAVSSDTRKRPAAGTTEYTLLHAFSEFRGHKADLQYVDAPLRAVGFWNNSNGCGGWPYTDAETKDWISMIDSPSVVFVAIHRSRKFSAEQKKLLIATLDKYIDVHLRLP